MGDIELNKLVMSYFTITNSNLLYITGIFPILGKNWEELPWGRGEIGGGFSWGLLPLFGGG